MKVYGFITAALASLALLGSPAARAQAWPAKPITMIVPQGAGGSTDALARLVGQALGTRLGQTVVIDNRAGAGGVLGATAAAKAAPDGYTLLFGSSTTTAANAFLYTSFPGDPLKIFVPLALVADAPFVFVVPTTSPVKSMHDLVAAAKATPGKLNYGYGTSSGLICTELLKSVAGLEITKVPYRSSAQALTDLMSGQLDVICEPLSTSGPNAKAGRLRILALTGKTRSSLAPDIPTVAEAGVPGMSYTAWIGVYAPAGLPPELATKLGGELLAVLKEPGFAEKVRGIGFDPRPGDAEALAELHRAEMKSVAATVKAADIKPE